MLSKLWTKRASTKPVRSQAPAFRPHLEAMEERWVPDITDIVFTPANGVPVALAQPVGPGAPLYTSNPYEMMKTARQLPGMFKTSVRQAHNQATWELNQLVQGLYPTPPLGVAAFMLTYVNSNSPMTTTVTSPPLTETRYNYLFPGSVLTYTATMTGTIGPISNAKTEVVGSFTVPSGMWTEDGKLVYEFTVTNRTDQRSWEIWNNATWTGTKLLTEKDKGKSTFEFLQDATGQSGWSGGGKYDGTDIAMAQSTTALAVNANGHGTTVDGAHGDFHFYAPLRSGGQVKFDAVGDYYDNKYRLDAELNLKAANVRTSGDSLNARLHYLVGTDVAPADAGAQLSVSYGVGFIPAASDRVSVVFQADTRPGVQGFSVGGEYNLLGLPQNTNLRLGVLANSTTGLSVTGSVYSAPTPLVNVYIGFDYDPLTNTKLVKAQWRFGF